MNQYGFYQPAGLLDESPASACRPGGALRTEKECSFGQCCPQARPVRLLPVVVNGVISVELSGIFYHRRHRHEVMVYLVLILF